MCSVASFSLSSGLSCLRKLLFSADFSILSSYLRYLPHPLSFHPSRLAGTPKRMSMPLVRRLASTQKTPVCSACSKTSPPVVFPWPSESPGWAPFPRTACLAQSLSPGDRTKQSEPPADARLPPPPSPHASGVQKGGFSHTGQHPDHISMIPLPVKRRIVWVTSCESRSIIECT